MSTSAAPQGSSPLAARPLTVDAYPEYASRPFLEEVLELFRSVAEHDKDTLFARCDDDFGIVDLDTDGSSKLIRTREEWENWFTELFARLDAMGAETDTEIDRFEGLVSGDLGYNVVEFTQLLGLGGHVARFRCVVTIIWKWQDRRWVESRWHASLLDVEIPEGFGEAAAA